MYKKNYSLILGLLIPLLMIMFVAASIYLPTLFTKPAEYDFLYNLSSSYNNPYVVTQEKLTLAKVRADAYKTPSADKIYRYSVSTQTSTQLSFADAQKLRLRESKISPDGFTLVSGSGSSGMFPFFYSGPDENARYLKKNAYSQKIFLETDNYYDFSFLGWIVQ